MSDRKISPLDTHAPIFLTTSGTFGPKLGEICAPQVATKGLWSSKNRLTIRTGYFRRSLSKSHILQRVPKHSYGLYPRR